MAKITAAQYNAIQSSVSSILGTGSGNSGYGQTVASTQVTAGGTIRLSQFTNLRNDFVRIRNHQGIGITNGSGATGSPAGSYNQLIIPTSTSTISDALRIQYTNMSSQISTDKLSRPSEANLIAAFVNNTITVPAQFATTTLGNGAGSNSTTATFNGSRVHTITITGSTSNPASGNQGSTVANSAANLRHFFNAGGGFRFSSSRTGGSVNNKNTFWTNLLSYGIIEFAGDTIRQVGTALYNGTLTTGVNYRTLTTSPQTFFTIPGSLITGATNTPYQSASVTMAASRSSDSSTITITITYNDASVGGGGAFDEQIDGTWASNFTLLRPAGNIQVSGTNSVTAIAPSVTSTMT